jgi:hypothetical protein
MDGVCLWAALQATKGFGGGNSSQQHQGLYATTTAGGSTGMGTQTSTSSTQTGIITLDGIISTLNGTISTQTGIITLDGNYQYP